jgi:hypothetical protein
LGFSTSIVNAGRYRYKTFPISLPTLFHLETIFPYLLWRSPIPTVIIVSGLNIPFGTMKWELEKFLSPPTGVDKKEGALFKNLKGLIGLI